jgi:hypothetical protein
VCAFITLLWLQSKTVHLFFLPYHCTMLISLSLFLGHCSFSLSFFHSTLFVSLSLFYTTMFNGRDWEKWTTFIYLRSLPYYNVLLVLFILQYAFLLVPSILPCSFLFVPRILYIMLVFSKYFSCNICRQLGWEIWQKHLGLFLSALIAIARLQVGVESRN